MSDYDIDGESYPGEWEAAAREAYLLRQRNLGRGWHPGRWTDPAALLRSLEDRFLDPVEARAMAHLQEARRLSEDHVTVAEALRWVREHEPRHEGLS